MPRTVSRRRRLWLPPLDCEASPRTTTVRSLIEIIGERALDSAGAPLARERKPSPYECRVVRRRALETPREPSIPLLEIIGALVHEELLEITFVKIRHDGPALTPEEAAALTLALSLDWPERVRRRRQTRHRPGGPRLDRGNLRPTGRTLLSAVPIAASPTQ